MKTKKILLGVLSVIFLAVPIFFSGCATGPRNMAEMNPQLGAEPGQVLVIVEGTPAAKIFFFDRAGALVQDWSEAGANPYFTVNGRTDIRFFIVRLPFGHYQVEIRPFYYSAIFRQAAELPIRRASVRVDGQVDTYESKYTLRHWDAVLRIKTGRIPDRHMVGPRMDVSGTGFPGELLKTISGGR